MKRKGIILLLITTILIISFSYINSGKDSVSAKTIFSDVNGSADKNSSNYQYYYTPVYWAAEKGITAGYPDGTFGVGKDCDRASVMIFLWRLGGCPAPKKDARDYFTDLKGYTTSTATNKSVAWAYENGIAKGYDDGTFGVKKSITRAEVLIMLYRFAGKPAIDGKLTFKDCGSYKPTTDTYKAIIWGSQKGITAGYPDGTFGPTLLCLREQIITFIYRFSLLSNDATSPTAKTTGTISVMNNQWGKFYTSSENKDYWEAFDRCYVYVKISNIKNLPSAVADNPSNAAAFRIDIGDAKVTGQGYTNTIATLDSNWYHSKKGFLIGDLDCHMNDAGELILCLAYKTAGTKTVTLYDIDKNKLGSVSFTVLDYEKELKSFIADISKKTGADNKSLENWQRLSLFTGWLPNNTYYLTGDTGDSEEIESVPYFVSLIGNCNIGAYLQRKFCEYWDMPYEIVSEESGHIYTRTTPEYTGAWGNYLPYDYNWNSTRYSGSINDWIK